ncbi:MAG TPA: MarR family transcriptional regulator [Solirubrobacteraceae bacterium]|nr:MarR family transcriptional regulator [Solirubrobacteraceae bacterium]
MAAESLPYSALLSQALVAFTIEADNVWESEMPHRTTRYGGSPRAPYATSLRQWSNFMRVLGEGGLTVGELERRTRAKPQLDAMRRWGYVTIEPAPDDPRQKPPQLEHMVVPTAAGRRAQSVWRRLPETIEARWGERFGASVVGDIKRILGGLRDQLGLDLPHFLTSIHGGYVGAPGDGPVEVPRDPLPLSVLLSQVLHAFALEYEQHARASLAFSANVLRLVGDDGADIAKLPRRSGVSIEQTRVAAGILAKRGLLTVGSESGAAGKRARLTRRGFDARALYRSFPGEIEARWAERFGAAPVQAMRSHLESLATPSGTEQAPLWLGLAPPPGSWRDEIRPPEVLPHFPMPRQSGHPDGA